MSTPECNIFGMVDEEEFLGTVVRYESTVVVCRAYEFLNLLLLVDTGHLYMLSSLAESIRT